MNEQKTYRDDGGLDIYRIAHKYEEGCKLIEIDYTVEYSSYSVPM